MSAGSHLPAWQGRKAPWKAGLLKARLLLHHQHLPGTENDAGAGVWAYPGDRGETLCKTEPVK